MMRVEDDPEDTIVPQLVVAGADLNRVLLPEEPFVLDATGIAFLESYIQDYGVNLITIDPIVFYGGGKVNTDKANSVRLILQPLAALARKHKVTIIIVAHARKSGTGSMDDLMGSADYTNAVRSTIALYNDDKTEKLIFKHVKSNKGRTGSPWTFTIEDKEIVLDDGYRDTVGHFTFGEKLDEAGLVTKRGRPAGARKEAVEFLQTVLAHGDVEQAVLWAMAAEAQIAEATLKRAKDGVAESYYSKNKSMFMWRLARPVVH
jgi:putative DNA primase/helicase